MVWGILIVGFLGIVIAYVIVQEMRAHLYWRGLVESGDVSAMSALVTAEIDRWRTQRTPRGIPAGLWHGVQTVALQETAPDYVRVTAAAEAEYAVVNGVRSEISSALKEGMKVTVKLADMLLYDVPDVRVGTVQIDIYTTFRDAGGASTQQCILSTIFRRDEIGDLDWESASPEEVIRTANGRFQLSNDGTAQPITPDPPRNDRPSPNGVVAH